MPNDLPSQNRYGPHHLEMAGWLACAPFEASLGIDIVRAEDGEAELTLPFIKSLAQGAGLMHGGALCTLADTALAIAAKTLIEPYSHFGTISMEARVLRPVQQGIITAHAKITHRVERELHGVAHVVDEDGNRVLEFKSVNKLARDTRLRNVSFLD